MSLRIVGVVLALLVGCGPAGPDAAGRSAPGRDPEGSRARLSDADADQARIWLYIYNYACPVTTRKVEALGYQCPELPSLDKAECYSALEKGCAVDADLDGAVEGVDCDDLDEAVSPHAPEICGDGVDNDCDGADESCPALGLAEADARFAGEANYDWAGWSVAGAGDVDGDGYDDAAVGAPWQDGAGSAAGAVYLVRGGAELSGDLSSAATLRGELAGDQAGGAVAGAGDVDGDGYDELLIGASQADATGSASGAAYLVYGDPALSGALDLADAGARIYGEGVGDYAGCSVAGAGDVSGDGVPDLLIGARGADAGGSDAGAAYLIYGPVSGDIELGLADVRLSGESAGAQAGFSAAGLGDVDGDGLDDLLIGAPYESATASNAGAAYLVSGAASGMTDLAAADARLLGVAAGDYAGYAVAGAGDVNGDGYPDMLVGAFEEDSGGLDAGAAYLVYAPVSGDLELSRAGAILVGEEAGDHAGSAVAGVGDVDGDGLADLLIGAYRAGAGGSSTGAAYLFLGPVEGSLGMSRADLSLAGEASSDQAGYAAAGAGDMDGDGLPDLLIGAHGSDSAGADAGTVYLLLGAGI